MSSETAYLVLRLQGPLQSWGFDSQYNRRNTALMPTKSAIAGMCCAAFGYRRGCEEESTFLKIFRNLKMTAISIPRKLEDKELPVRRLQDYHTVQGTRRANGTINKDCVLTYRQYLLDAGFGVILEGDKKLIVAISSALKDPVWGIWLGRKACIPTTPVLAGVTDDKKNVIRILLGDIPLEKFTHQVEVDSFSDGRDSISDNPESFDSDRRLFSPRRVVSKPAIP